MGLGLIATHVRQVSEASSVDDLHEVLARSTRDLGFEHFALSVEIGSGAATGASVLVHDYPSSWADVYVGFNLYVTDPVVRAAENSLLGFRWGDIPKLIPVTALERRTFETGRRHGICDGFTVPRHMPGAVTGSCSFVIGPDHVLPEPWLAIADAVGAAAIARANVLAGWVGPQLKPHLTDRQRDCVLWAARGKTDWEIARILGISRETVVQHMRDARIRYDTDKRASLILLALFDGLISFTDIFRWRERS